MFERQLTAIVGMTFLADLSWMLEWSPETNQVILKSLPVAMLALCVFREGRLFRFQNSRRTVWILYWLLLWSSMSIENQLMFMSLRTWLTIPGNTYSDFTIQPKLPRFFRLSMDDNLLARFGFLIWFMAYLSIQLQPLTTFLGHHLTSFVVIGEVLKFIYSILYVGDRLWSRNRTNTISTIVPFIVFHNRPDQQMLAFFAFISTYDLIKNIQPLDVSEKLFNKDMTDYQEQAANGNNGNAGGDNGTN